MMDASTLGKIMCTAPMPGNFSIAVHQRDELLAVGAVRYGVMCNLDGMVFDDGTVARLADNRFLVTTTTGNAAPVLEWMEEWLQTEWPDLNVALTSVTEQWPRSRWSARPRHRTRAACPDFSPLPFMKWREATWPAWPRGCSGSASPASWPTRSTCRPGTDTRCGKP